MSTTRKNAASRNAVFEIVRAQLLHVCREQRKNFNVDIRLDSSLVADLGLDSLSLVEAVVALEQALGIQRLPLDALHDRCEGAYLTVASLVDLCIEHTEPGAAAHEGVRP
jgi:acyl carrier protein